MIQIFQAGYLITCIEWLAFCCTRQYGAKWKEWFENTPFIVRHVFKNNFRTPVGITAISAGLQGLPIWFYVMKHYAAYLNETWSLVFNLVLVYCIIGRVLCMIVELWVIYKNLNQMLVDQYEEMKKK